MQTPTLIHVADLRIDFGLPVTIAETANGLRRVIPILGGRIRGTRLSGKIIAAGADNQLICLDGLTKLDARCFAELDDGSILYIVNTGVRYRSLELASLDAGEDPSDADAAYFRTVPTFETVSERHAWLTRPLFIGSGVRRPTQIEIGIFAVK
ncbi:MAG: DUF3237 domain-containing protein [Beijerinckiaceae bacterium]|nr:DUF3237 domain-containing protein [Beijerinckiaceae bacterium]